MKPFFTAPKPSMELTYEPEFKFKFIFIVNYICNSQMISFWILEAENFYSAYRKVFDELSTKNFLEYFRTPEGICDSYTSYTSEFEVINRDLGKIIKYDYFGNLISVNHDYPELTTTLVF